MAENVNVVSKLDMLWTKTYERSKVFAKHEVERLKKKEARQEKEDRSRGNVSSASNGVKRSGNSTQHSLITKRFKELRKSGCSMKDAMAQARNEYGMDDDRDDPGKKVAAIAKAEQIMRAQNPAIAQICEQNTTKKNWGVDYTHSLAPVAGPIGHNNPCL